MPDAAVVAQAKIFGGDMVVQSDMTVSDMLDRVLEVLHKAETAMINVARKDFGADAS